MLPTVIGICIVAYIILILTFLMKRKGKDEKLKETTLIKAPSETEIKKEKEYWSKTKEEFIYPDAEFEFIIRYILEKDPNPRKVVKLIQTGFSESDKKMLMLCLSINNPILYNEVLSIQYCDSTEFEEFEDSIIEVEEHFNSEQIIEKEIQGGIPADFFMTALEYDKDSENILDNITNAFESLPLSEQEMILKHCEKIRKNKRERRSSSKQSIDPYTSIMEEADQDADEFMKLYKESIQRN